MHIPRGRFRARAGHLACERLPDELGKLRAQKGVSDLARCDAAALGLGG
jgi:hypothetical protein